MTINTRQCGIITSAIKCINTSDCFFVTFYSLWCIIHISINAAQEISALHLFVIRAFAIVVCHNLRECAIGRHLYIQLVLSRCHEQTPFHINFLCRRYILSIFDCAKTVVGSLRICIHNGIYMDKTRQQRIVVAAANSKY